VLVESVTYSNALPWPTGADGTGMSLQRRFPGLRQRAAQLGRLQSQRGVRNCLLDTDGDGLPDDWEVANGLNPNSALGNDGANGDPTATALPTSRSIWPGPIRTTRKVI